MSHIKKYKQKIKINQDKIVLCIGVFLIAIIAFGLGRLSSNIGSNLEPIEIIDASIYKTIKTEQKQGIFVGSKNSDKYHLLDCVWAGRIKKENKIWFSSVQEAEKKGYKPAHCLSH